MIFLGTVVNAGAVVIGGTVGVLLKKSIPERFKSIYFQAIALFIIAIGINMVHRLDNVMVVLVSLILGSFIGEFLNLEIKIEKLSQRLKTKFKIANENFSDGFIGAFLLFCMGSLTIMGAIQEGVDGSSELLLTKAFLDGFTAIFLASLFGLAVILSSIPLFLFQASITLLAYFAAEFFSEDMVNGLKIVSGVMLIALGLNVLEIKKIHIVNMIPSLFVVLFLIWLCEKIGF